MTKEEQFLWITQTTILANAVNIASQLDHAAQFRHNVSPTGVAHLIREAISASERIPTDMSASDAADKFCGFMLDNLRPNNAKCPQWFARPYKD